VLKLGGGARDEKAFTLDVVFVVEQMRIFVARQEFGGVAKIFAVSSVGNLSSEVQLCVVCLSIRLFNCGVSAVAAGC
jgi:hypothetical protein